MNSLRSTICSLTFVMVLTVLMVVTAASQTATPRPDPPKAEDATRIGLVTPRVNLLGGGGSVMQETSALQKNIGSFLTGPRIGTVDLRAKLDSLALEEGKERFCDYVLYVSVTRQRQSARNVSSYGTGTKSGDEFTFTFRIVSTHGEQGPVERVLKGTASAEGQDVLTPMVETMAQVVVDLAKTAKPSQPANAGAAVEVSKPPTNTAPSPSIQKAPTGYGSLMATPKGTTSNRTNDPPKQEGTIRIGLVMPRVNTTGAGTFGGQNEAASLTSTLTGFLAGSNIETIDLKARLDTLTLTEAQRRECDFVLYMTLLRKRSSAPKGSGPLNSIAGSIGTGSTGTKVPGTKTAAEVTTQAARVSNAIATFNKANDEITFEYKLVTSANARPVATKITKAKVKTDGEDVLTPIIESAAKAILETTVKN